MESIIILAIIFLQFALIHFGVKYLSALNKRIVLLNEKVENFQPLIKINFEKTRAILQKINNIMKKYIENEDKIKIFKLIILLNSLFVVILMLRKKKNIFNFYSLYDIITKTVKAILGF